MLKPLYKVYQNGDLYAVRFRPLEGGRVKVTLERNGLNRHALVVSVDVGKSLRQKLLTARFTPSLFVTNIPYPNGFTISCTTDEDVVERDSHETTSNPP